jgi:putative ubiquitin-RnfH superfamily antitoxin RatB of RatAB toxin-antitoxin module
MAETSTIRVEVAYAEPAQQFLQMVVVAANAKAQDAIEASGVLVQFPQIDLGVCRIGVWSRVVAADTPLHDGDRVEIYRPLQVDPKEVRRQRAEKMPVGRKRG